MPSIRFRASRVIPHAIAASLAAIASVSVAQQPPPSDATTSATTPAPVSGLGNGFRLGDTRVLLQTSVYGKHWHPQPDHNNSFRLVNLEGQRADNWVYGLAIFHNSFGQPSQYVYVGKQWRPFASQPLVHLKLTGGILHGYKGEYRDKIPFNGNGIAPALLPSVGISGKRFSSDLVLFGTAGMMLTFGVYLN